MQEFAYMETLLQITLIVIPQRWKNISFEEYLILLTLLQKMTHSTPGRGVMTL